MQCPNCQSKLSIYRNPVPTVDIIITYNDGIILIKRRNPPLGWALPGGFVDYGENLEMAAIREAKEETGLDIKLKQQFHTYSDPNRDERLHTITTVYLASGHGTLQAGDDASQAMVFYPPDLPQLAFDHGEIIDEYLKFEAKLPKT